LANLVDTFNHQPLTVSVNVKIICKYDLQMITKLIANYYILQYWNEIWMLKTDEIKRHIVERI